MVNYSLDTTFASLADPTRRDILSRLRRGELSVSEIAKPYDITLPAISRHLKVLEKASLIIRRKQGKEHFIQINAPAFTNAEEYIRYYTTFWESNLDSLKNYLERTD
jgi:DNA-binding transcriptional ArsR family regulator